MPSGWSRPAAARPPSSAARHASPTAPYSADEQVPNQGNKKGKCRLVGVACTTAKKYGKQLQHT